jgi:hypothetical protein
MAAECMPNVSACGYLQSALITQQPFAKNYRSLIRGRHVYRNVDDDFALFIIFAHNINSPSDLKKIFYSTSSVI